MSSIYEISVTLHGKSGSVCIIFDTVFVIDCLVCNESQIMNAHRETGLEFELQ